MTTDVLSTPHRAQALENYENGVLTKPKEVSPWWLRYSLVLFQEQQVRPSVAHGCVCICVRVCFVHLVFQSTNTRVFGRSNGRGISDPSQY